MNAVQKLILQLGIASNQNIESMETNSENKNCLCGNADYIVMACSGACDLGFITDTVARRLSSNKVRKMNCLAVVGAGIKPSIEGFKKTNILLIDGCPTECGKRILDREGFTNYQHLRITDLGYVKGQTPVAEDVVKAVYDKAEVIF